MSWFNELLILRPCSLQQPHHHQDAGWSRHGTCHPRASHGPKKGPTSVHLSFQEETPTQTAEWELSGPWLFGDSVLGAAKASEPAGQTACDEVTSTRGEDKGQGSAKARPQTTQHPDPAAMSLQTEAGDPHSVKSPRKHDPIPGPGRKALCMTHPGKGRRAYTARSAWRSVSEPAVGFSHCHVWAPS